LRRIGKFLHSELRGDTERGRLVRSAGATATLKIGATALAFGASLVYARVLGAHDYGLYAYVAAWAALLSIPAGLGIPAYLTREGSKWPGSVNFLRRWADMRVLVSGIVVGVILACAYFFPQAAGARFLFIIAAPLPLINNLGNVRRALLQACGWVARAQWPFMVLGPALMLAAILGIWMARGKLSPIDVMSAMTAAALVPLLVNHRQLRRASGSILEPSHPSPRLRVALTFMWLGGLYMVNSRMDLLILGAIKGAHAAGVYAVSVRAAELVTFFLAGANMVLAPRIARLYHQENRDFLQRLLSRASLRIFMASIPVALVFILFGGGLLGYLYGAEYEQGATALRILAVAQLANVFVGSTGTIMNMTGHESIAMRVIGLSVVLNVALNFALVPAYGASGAAFATGISLVVWNLVLWYWIRRRTGLRPSALGI